ncbi:MAG: hypothetical protein ACW9W3_06900 [Candidatus Nitrosopumilus sp. bin_68KS]
MPNNIVKLLKNHNFLRITKSNQDVYNLIHSMENQDQCILFFNTEANRDKIVNEFIHPKGIPILTTGCFSQVSSKYDCSQNITYNELIQNNKLESNKISEFLVSLLDKAHPHNLVRVACEDTSWFSEVGFFEEHQKAGSQLNKKVLNGLSLLCCYNPSKLDDDKINVILKSRDYVILEEPFSVFKKIYK